MTNKRYVNNQIQIKLLFIIMSIVFNQALLAGQTSGFNGRIYEQSSLNTNSLPLQTSSLEQFASAGSVSSKLEFDMSPYIEVSHMDAAHDNFESSNTKSVFIAGNSANLIIEAINEASSGEVSGSLNSEELIDLQIVLEGELITQISVTSVTDAYVELSGVTDSGSLVTLFIEQPIQETNNDE